MSLCDGMNVRLGGGIQIPAARCEFPKANRFHRTKFLNDLGALNIQSATNQMTGSRVANPTFLNSLEGL
jgi:hypothetical protein